MKGYSFGLLIMTVTIQVDRTFKAAAATTPTTPPTTAPTSPTLTYTCTTDGTVTITFNDVTGFSRYTVSTDPDLGSLKTNATKYKDQCQKELQQISGTVTLTACGLDKKLYVYIMKERISKIYGGKDFHEYIISCADIPANGVTVKAIAKVTIATTLSTVPTPVTEIVTPNVIMSLSNPNNVFIGEKHILSVAIVPASTKWFVLPQTCSAKSGISNTSAVTIDLLKNSVTTDSEILSDFTVDKDLATADLYAFRFTDSASVILECTVLICNDRTCNNTFLAYQTKAPSGGSGTGGNRRRRAAGMPRRRTHVVRTQFTVKEKQVTEAAGHNIGGSIFQTVMAMVMLLLIN